MALLPYLLGLLFISIISIHAFLSLRRKGVRTYVTTFIGANSIFFLLQAALILSWMSGFVKQLPTDLLLVTSIFSVIEAVIILFIVYGITGNKHILFLLLLFLLSCVPLYYNVTLFFGTATVIANVLTLLLFGDLVFVYTKNPEIRISGIIGMAYSIIAIIAFALLFFFQQQWAQQLFTAALFLLGLSIYFLAIGYSLKKAEPQKQAQKKTGVSLPMLFVRYSFFVVGLCMFLFLSTISIHELGHTALAQFYGCDTKTILFQSSMNPHTEFTCSGPHNSNVITMGGVLFPLLIALLFLMTTEPLIVKIAYLIIGFNLFISFRDLKELSLSESAVFIIIAISIITVIVAIIRLSLYYLYQQAQVYFTGGEP